MHGVGGGGGALFIILCVVFFQFPVQCVDVCGTQMLRRVRSEHNEGRDFFLVRVDQKGVLRKGLLWKRGEI